MSDEFTIHCSIDTRGLRCPIPLLRAKQALKTMKAGEYLEVLTTDPSAKGDFEAMLKHLPHELVQHSFQPAGPNMSAAPSKINSRGYTAVERFVICKHEAPNAL